jgi:hypothetical protein
LAVSGIAILVRLVWVFPDAYLPRRLNRHVRETEPRPAWQNVIIFLTFAVIAATLILQGLTLAPLMYWLKMKPEGGCAGTGQWVTLRPATVGSTARLALVGQCRDEVLDLERLILDFHTDIERLSGEIR